MDARFSVLVIALVTGCVPAGREQTLLQRNDSGAGDTGGLSADVGDAAVPEDSGTIRDALVPDARPDTGVRPGPVDTGVRLDSGTTDTGTPDSGAPYCGDNNCDPNESCTDCEVDCGDCACDFGFVLDNNRCVPDAPEPFRSRTPTEICNRWQQDYVSIYPEWEPTPGSTDPCDPGTIHQHAHDNAIERTNLYRWLVNLNPIVEDPSIRARQQACAVLQKAIGHLDHHPGSDEECYTPEGAQGAGSSNLSMGSSMAGSVDAYIADNRVTSLGHRRWVLNPGAQVTAFGIKPPYSCMYSFSGGGSINVDFVSWPPPGYVPKQAARGVWSFHSNDIRETSSTTVEITLDGQPTETVSHYSPAGGYGWGSVMGFSPTNNTSVWQTGKTVRVALRDTTQGDFEYTVHFVDCP